MQLGLDAPKLGEEAGAAEAEVKVVAGRGVRDEDVGFDGDAVRPGVRGSVVLKAGRMLVR